MMTSRGCGRGEGRGGATRGTTLVSSAARQQPLSGVSHARIWDEAMRCCAALCGAMRARAADPEGRASHNQGRELVIQ